MASRRWNPVLVFVASTLLSGACGDDSTAPELSLVGTWDLIGFSDGGIAAVTTGTWVFRADGTFSVDGTVTFPGEPPDPLTVDGEYVFDGEIVTLTSGLSSSDWTLTSSGDEITLTEDEPPPANTITLQRQ